MATLLERAADFPMRWRDRRARARPEGAVWYIEARRFSEQEGVPGSIPEEPAVCGSGVVVRIEQLHRVDGSDGARWEPSDPPLIRKYLLTCAHVVRGFKSAPPGWKPLLGEILCWRPGSHYLRWLVPDRPRRSGESDPVGAHRAKVKFAAIGDEGSVAEHDAIAVNDWVLLELSDGPTGAFADAPSVEAWRHLADDGGARELAVIGYPGGAASWRHNDRVVPHRSESFTLKREDAAGGVALVGADETRAGMSGGGVFDDDGALVGIHRAATDMTMERHLVVADSIRRWLEERGMRPAPARSRQRPGLLLPASLLGLGIAFAAAWYFDAADAIGSLFRSAAEVCVQVQGSEEPVVLKPVAQLQMSLVPDGWTMPEPLSAITDSSGKACFVVPLSRKLRGRESLPFHIRCDKAPGALQALEPMIVHPYGITTGGLKREAWNLRHYLERPELPALSLSAWSEKKWLAAQLSRRVAASTAVGDETARIAVASAGLGLSAEQRRESVEAWASVLRTERPVVPVARLTTADAAAIQKVASAVGAYYEDGQWRATGFAVSRSVVLLPAFAVRETGTHERRIAFAERADVAAGRVRLGRTLWRSPPGTPGELSVCLVQALDALPDPPDLSTTLAIEPGRKLYVIGYPAEDPRTPASLRAIFAFGERSAMFGEALTAGTQQARIDHDATTTGGTGGGPLVDRTSHAVVGVHLAGQFEGALTKRNFAAPMAALLADPAFRTALGDVASRRTVDIPAIDASRADPLGVSSTDPKTAGYDPMFLGIRLPFPVPGERSSAKPLDYLHYSVLMSEERRTARVAAANFDRTTQVRLQRSPDVWYADPRLPVDAQPSAKLFGQNALDQGQLIARQALTWGSPDVARLSSLAAFYWPNVTPQHESFNRISWARLERRVYEELHPESRRVSVFAGPVEDSADVVYRGFRIPRQFWMVAVYQNAKAPTHPIVHAYLADQYPAGAANDPGSWPAAPEAVEVKLADVERAARVRFQFPASR